MLKDNECVELKKGYPQASQICYLDRVNEDMKGIAEEMFIQINEAYKKNDVAEVKGTLSELKYGMSKP